MCRRRRSTGCAGRGAGVVGRRRRGTIPTTSGSAIFDVDGGSGGGGDITLEANGPITLAGDMTADGNDGAGGISITAGIRTGDTLTVQSTSRIEAVVPGTAEADDGTVDFTACNVSLAGVVTTRNINSDGFGTNGVSYRGTFSTAGSSSLLADNAVDAGENLVNCRCIDTSPADGVCDSPATCASSPSFSGTVTPTATIVPVAMAACTTP